jgi:hypothetical protein
MKTLVIIMVMATTGCFAAENNSITSRTHDDGLFFGFASKVVSGPPHVASKIYEYKDKAGKCVGSMEQVYRGNDEIMMVMRSLNSLGDLVVSSRSYFIHGDMVMTEMATRKDDKLDTIIFRHPGSDDLEVFRRQADGSVRPASTELVQAFINQNSVMSKMGPDDFNHVKNQKILEELGDKIAAAIKASDEAK